MESIWRAALGAFGVMLMITPVFAQDQQTNLCEAARQADAQAPTEEPCDETDTTTSSPDPLFRFFGSLADDGLPVPNRRLRALSREAMREALEDGFDFDEDIALGEIASVGVLGGLQVILPEDQTDLQTEFAGDDVWLRTMVGSQWGIGLDRRINVGPDGLFIRVGAKKNSQFRVELERPYERQTVDVVRNAPRQHFNVPFAAEDLEGCRPGEKTKLTNEGNIILRGGVGVGFDTEDFTPGVSAGATAEIGASRVLTGIFETEIECLKGKRASVKLRTTDQVVNAVALEIFAGVSVNLEDLEVPLSTGVNFIDNEIEEELEEIGSVEISVRRGQLSREGTLIDYSFDLGRKYARIAYQAAVQGDYRLAAALAKCPDGGVSFVQEVNDQLEDDFDEKNLRVSRVYEYRYRHSVTDRTTLTEDTDGTERADDAGVSVRRDRKLAGDGELELHAIHRRREHANGDLTDELVVDIDGESEEIFTSKGDMKKILGMARALLQHDPSSVQELEDTFAEPPEGEKSWGESRAALSMKIYEPGIRTIAMASEDEMYAAFGASYKETPKWATAAGRAELERDYRLGQRARGSARRSTRPHGWSQYQRAKTAVGLLQELKNTTDRTVAAQLIRDAAEAMHTRPILGLFGRSYDPAVVIGLSNLAGPEHRDMKLRIQTEVGNMDYTFEQLAGQNGQ